MSFSSRVTFSIRHNKIVLMFNYRFKFEPAVGRSATYLKVINSVPSKIKIVTSSI